MSQDTSDYDRLRSWYLARLRAQAIVKVQPQDLTPAALMQADREAVERLIAEHTRKHVTMSAGGFAESSRWLGKVWLALSASFFAITVLACGGNALVALRLCFRAFNPFWFKVEFAGSQDFLAAIAASACTAVILGWPTFWLLSEVIYRKIRSV